MQNGRAVLVVWRLFAIFVAIKSEAMEKGNEGGGKRREVVPSMKRRALWHDYRGLSIYMVTIETGGRRPLLCEIEGTPAAPRVWPSPLGRALKEAWERMAVVYDGVRPLWFQLMPDHLHGILHFDGTADVHLGRVVNGLKIAGNKAYRAAGLASAEEPSLWAPGYHDRVLGDENHLARMVKYVKDNPRRALMRRANPRLFEVVHDLEAAGRKFEAQGNIFLLERPERVAVRVSRRVKTGEEIAAVVERFVAMARGGAVLVSPSISPGEMAVRDALLDAELPFVLVRPSGFERYGKPSGRLFEACAAGRLLQVSEHPFTTRRVELTRPLCEEMNSLAAALATPPPGE